MNEDKLKEYENKVKTMHTELVGMWADFKNIDTQDFENIDYHNHEETVNYAQKAYILTDLLAEYIHALWTHQAATSELYELENHS